MSSWFQAPASLYSAVTELATGVTGIATKIVAVVEETTKEFDQEQQKFISEKPLHERENARESEAVPPWSGLQEEELLKQQIIELSTEKRNFLMDPPPGTEFVFDLVVYMPIAKAIMKEDPRLESMRYSLVPKQVKEENFWRNYFYRVSLIKQSVQFNTMNKRLDQSTTEEAPSDPSTSQRTPTPLGDISASHSTDLDSDFISDSIPEKSDAWIKEMKAELDQLGVTVEDEPTSGNDDYDWEKELAKELGDFESKKDSDWESEVKELLDDQ